MRLAIAGILLAVILVAVGLAITDLANYAKNAKNATSNQTQPSSPSAASTSAP